MLSGSDKAPGTGLVSPAAQPGGQRGSLCGLLPGGVVNERSRAAGRKVSEAGARAGPAACAMTSRPIHGIAFAQVTDC
jgi:hypothetical protein